jgi:hypothetical protein
MGFARTSDLIKFFRARKTSGPVSRHVNFPWWRVAGRAHSDFLYAATFRVGSALENASGAAAAIQYGIEDA